MIILEGPDGTGKTTLAERLAKEFNRRVQHSGGPPKDQSDIFARQERAMQFALHNAPVVMDRVPAISERIYGPIIRGKDPFQGSDYLPKLMQAMPLPLIYCRPPLEVIRENMAATHSKKEHETEEHFAGVMKRWETVIEAYDELIDEMQAGWVEVIRYDYTGRQSADAEQVIAQLRNLGAAR